MCDRVHAGISGSVSVLVGGLEGGRLEAALQPCLGPYAAGGSSGAVLRGVCAAISEELASQAEGGRVVVQRTPPTARQAPVLQAAA